MTWRIYRNLHRKRWSLLMDRRVFNHPEWVVLYDCEFRVSEAGRQRVLRERRKNVHAYVAGRTAALVRASMGFDMVQVRYNPYEGPTFVRTDTGEPVFRAPLAVFDSDGKVWIMA